MARAPKATKTQPDEAQDIKDQSKQLVTLQDLAIMVSENKDLVRLGALSLKKQDSSEVRTVEDLIGSMNQQQITYLNLRAEGIKTELICKELGISRLSVMLWEEEDMVFKACLAIIKRMEANDAEEVLWHEAKKNPRAKELLMFGLRARKPEYQEGSSLGGLAQTKVEINIGGVTFDQKASLKDAGSDLES